uniref:Uncharacterized protein n=1 Tax=Gadus morhua TaxID=8049 RepID=A0A8C5FF42_GADMO
AYQPIVYYDFSLSKLSSVTSWLNPLFRIGYKRTLEGKDLYNVLPENRSKTLGETLQRYWDEECLKTSKDLKEPSLSKAIICCHWKLYSVWLVVFILMLSSLLVIKSYL